MTDLDKNYWENRYQSKDTGWDIGEISRPLKEYFDQLTNKNLKILIPGCGSGYEAEYLFKKGFTRVYPADVAPSAKEKFFARVPDFPKENWMDTDFFEIKDSFDLIIEQTFFCALEPSMRGKYVVKMADLLQNGGKLVGLLFTEVPNKEGPPFGGNKEEYLKLFKPYFENIKMEKCYNSIEPRAGRELFVRMEKMKLTIEN